MTMNRRVEEGVIATYATNGNLQRIRVTIERDGTYSYSEWHRLRLVGRGANYPTRAAIEKVVANLIKYAREIDGTDFRKTSGE